MIDYKIYVYSYNYEDRDGDKLKLKITGNDSVTITGNEGWKLHITNTYITYYKYG